MKLLFLYSTHQLQTEKIIKHISNKMPGNFCIDLIQIDKEFIIDLAKYDAVLIGTSIKYGYYHKLIKSFIDKHFDALNNMPSAFFGVNLVASKPNKNTPETNVYTRKFLQKIKWHPKLTAVFAGALNYPKYNIFDRTMIRFIMKLTKGETNTSIPFVEYTNWDDVDLFSHKFLTLITKQ